MAWGGPGGEATVAAGALALAHPADFVIGRVTGGGGLCLPFLSLVLVFFWTWTLYRLCTYIPLAQVLYVCNNINDDVIIIIIIKRRSGINPIPPTVIDRD